MTDEAQPLEQRQALRQSFITFAWYKRVSEEGTAAADLEEGLARSCDISEGGAGLVTSRTLPEGARVFVEIVSNAGALSLVARVAHCQPTGDAHYRIGLELEIVPPNDRQTLARILAS